MLAQAVSSTRFGANIAPKHVGCRRSAVIPSAVAVERPLALPFAEPPAYLDGTLPCDYGFDPLRLCGEDGKLLDRMQEGEVINGRFAMLGVVGAFIIEPLGLGNWMEAPMWAVEGGKPTYLGIELPYPEGADGVNNSGLLVLLEIILVGSAEALRGNQSGDADQRLYPGGYFDPFGLSDTDPESLLTLKKKELANGRLAMLGCLAYYVQGQVTGEGPYANLLSVFGK